MLSAFIAVLHGESSKARRTYSKQMLKEDYIMGLSSLYMGVFSQFAGLFETMTADHPLWVLFVTILPRYVVVMRKLGVAQFNLDMAKRLGLVSSPSVVFPPAEHPKNYVSAFHHSKASPKKRFRMAAARIIAAGRFSSFAFKAKKALKTPVPPPAAEDRDAFLQAHYPKNLAGVTTQWLAALMNCTLLGHDVKKVLEAGVTSDAAVLGLQYGPGAAGPNTIVLKYAKASEMNREVAQSAMMYEKEILFYQQLAPIVMAAGMPIPEVLSVFVDKDKPKEFYCIAMQDLSAEHDPIDQTASPPPPTQAHSRHRRRQHRHGCSSSSMRQRPPTERAHDPRQGCATRDSPMLLCVCRSG